MIGITLLCVIVLVLTIKLWNVKRLKFNINKPIPGPDPWPVIGSLHLLGKCESPFEAFTALSKIYGDIFSITLGSTPCVIVNNFDLIKEVLITKGGDFGGRPDFMRFHKLFGGDRNNSLALCDWSVLQKTRRSIARTYCSPRFTSIQYATVNTVGSRELEMFMLQLRKFPVNHPVDIKPVVLGACANMFMQYMCSASFSYEDVEFKKMVRDFDNIFWEINQGYAVDFLPWLLPIYNEHMNKLSQWAADIREFILARIVRDHINTLDYQAPPRDFTDALLIHLKEDSNMEWKHIMFELEDFIGGHSAVGNLIMLTLASIIENPQVAKKIQDEVDNVTKGQRYVNLFDKADMPYTEAVLWETLRKGSSPIVPHVASIDTNIKGYRIKQGTIIFLNNYELNLSAEYWDEPQKFKPERFISSTGNIVKPPHFIPFSTGKRTCIGQRLVQCFTFIIISTLLQNYNISSGSQISIKRGCVAVPPDCFKIILTPRDKYVLQSESSEGKQLP